MTHVFLSCLLLHINSVVPCSSLPEELGSKGWGRVSRTIQTPNSKPGYDTKKNYVMPRFLKNGIIVRDMINDVYTRGGSPYVYTLSLL